MNQRKLDRRAPRGLRRLADGADPEFVSLARTVMRLISWQPPFLDAPGDDAGETVGPAQPASADPARPLPPRAAALLAERVDQIVKKRTVTAASVGETSAASVDPERLLQLRALFHQEPSRRSQAIRWVVGHDCREAIPTLEGIYVIEENPGVRSEIVRALWRFGRAAPPPREARDVQEQGR